jgi:hypothetical protein
MSPFRVSVGAPGADAGAVVGLARAAEECSLDAIWIGDPGGEAANADDAYVMVTAAACAAVTSDIRIGVFLWGDGSTTPLRLAEDIGVVDTIAAGRLSVAFVPPGAADDESRAGLFRILEAWQGWELPGGGVVSITPGPAQPQVPAWLVAPGPSGRHLLSLREEIRRSPILVQPWSGEPRLPSVEEVLKLVAEAESAGAEELLLTVEASPGRLDETATQMAAVLAPCSRACPDEVELLAHDARRWWEECTHLHRLP